ncbi:hypothetical protein RUM44_013765 [Polyplax serrata]|uniref:Uncharacterized protein n=1 Tax=Polyplax serrata TaxID=468196 RepID=A0ABR1BJ69_POLSC
MRIQTMVQLCETGFCQFPQIRPRDWPDTKENFLLVESSIKKWSFSFLYKGKIRVCSEIKKEKTQRQQVEVEKKQQVSTERPNLRNKIDKTSSNKTLELEKYRHSSSGTPGRVRLTAQVGYQVAYKNRFKVSEKGSKMAVSEDSCVKKLCCYYLRSFIDKNDVNRRLINSKDRRM